MKKIVYIIFSFIIAQNPVSDAGVDQVVQLGEQVQLDGTNSYDNDGSISSYNWSSSDDIILTGEDTANPSFTAPSNLDTLTFNLIVEDNDGNESLANSADDIFISEYHDGSTPNQYIEIYNGTDAAVDLTGYELWILKSENDMTWTPT